MEKLPRLSMKALGVHLLLLGVVCYGSGGFVPIEELKFAAAASVYLLILSRFAFPPVTDKRPPHAYRGSKLLKLYVSIGAIVGLVFPLIYILTRFFTGEHLEQVEGFNGSPAPHTVLLLLQIISEVVSSSLDSVSFPIRAFVPISYNAWRLFTIWSWIWETETGSTGRLLALSNMAFWSFNLFCFLLPKFLPLAMRSYYQAALQKQS